MVYLHYDYLHEQQQDDYEIQIGIHLIIKYHHNGQHEHEIYIIMEGMYE